MQIREYEMPIEINIQVSNLIALSPWSIHENSTFSPSSGTVHAHVRITFMGKTTWKDSLILQDSLEREGLLGSTASITDCTADDGCE